MVNILYVSTLCSQTVLDYIFNTANRKPELAAQKFHSLIVKGMAHHSEKATIKTLSAIPVIPSNHYKRVWCLKNELYDRVKYQYIPMLNIRFIKSIGVFLYTFIKVFFFGVSRDKDSQGVVCDFLKMLQ